MVALVNPNRFLSVSGATLPAVETPLQQQWSFGAQIGGGGFARVIKATDENGVLHAAKFVEKQPGASRELLLADLEGARNVLPVIDSGEFGDAYVLVMPLADMSLREHIEQAGPLPQADALQILVDVATALADLEGKVVHRDLKPENVLLLNGSWCLADFGISRYVDATTEADATRKRFMSAPYAAPEQWMDERATAATDIYAFGVMGFELLEGRRPFDGTREDLRDHHLYTDAPAPSVGPVLAAMVQECLFKAPEARPGATNLLAKLVNARDHAADSRWERLAWANHAEVQRRAEREAATAREQTELKRRDRLFSAAEWSWSRISEQFQEVINDYLTAATINVRHDKHWSIELNGAKFGLSYPKLQSVSRPELPFDVIATATLSVRSPAARDRGDGRWAGRSHSLYFADVMVEREYAWFETAFMDMPLIRGTGSRDQQPFAIDDLGDVALHHALGKVVGECQIAWEFTRVESGHCDNFIQRWLEWFAAAAEGELSRPSRMPERDVPQNWRRG